MPALKRMIQNQIDPGALKRSFPRMNAEASTFNLVESHPPVW